jgi:uncharacterized protein with PIN domain
LRAAAGRQTQTRNGAGMAAVATIAIDVPDELKFLLAPAQRRGTVHLIAAETDTVGHVVEAAGIPLTEVGAIVRGGELIAPSVRAGGGSMRLEPITRPQPTPTWPPRFLLDVGLGGLARRLRILGLDAAYGPEADDPALVSQAAATGRVLLTQDRGLLRRRAVLAGALVRGAGNDDQLADVLDRFAPALAPWTRCTRCNGVLAPVSHDEVAAGLEPGTRQTYREFARCRDCRQVYWPGAHRARLDRVVEQARAVVQRRRNG